MGLKQSEEGGQGDDEVGGQRGCNYEDLAISSEWDGTFWRVSRKGESDQISVSELSHP